MNLRDVSDTELLSSLGRLLGSERELTARVVAHLGEIEERRLHLEAGYSSMFEFCVRRLDLSEGEAYRRVMAARLARRFPVIHQRLASGAVHLSALALLRDRLTKENHEELLDAVSGKSNREIEALLAARYPAPDVPSRIRKLPEARKAPDAPPPSAPPPALALAPAAPPRPRIEPLSASRHKVQFTASTELREKLERAVDLMSHANPGRDLATVVERALDLLLADLAKKRFGKREPRRARGDLPTKPGRPGKLGRKLGRKPGRITKAARRTVFARDGVQCAYVGNGGHRCEARAFLEVDHVHPKGLGGDDDPNNLRVLCRAHNQLLAEQVYGRDAMMRRKARVHPLSPARQQR